MFTDSKGLVILAALCAAAVNAHGHVRAWTIDGTDQPGWNPSYAGDYNGGVTAQRPSDNSGQGFTDYTVGKVACGSDNPGSGLQTYDVTAGSSVTANWNTWPDSHKGPVIEYMAACPASGCDGVSADSLKWFKIDESTNDGTTWASDTIVKTLKWSFGIPSDIAPGPYLVRHEIIAMHSTGAPQVYPYCFQANVKGSGSAVPSDTTTFPAAYNINDDFKTWNLYNGQSPSEFNAPGPAVYGGGGSGGSPAPAPQPAPEPSSSAAPAPVPEPSTSTSTASPQPTDTEPYPPVVDPVPEPSSSHPVVIPAPSPTPSPSPAPAPPVVGGELGGPAPPITQNGNRYEVNGGSYNDESSAKYASCMIQMNKCKDYANSLPNSEVGATFTKCDAQLTSCVGGARKRAVLNRYIRAIRA